MKTGLLAILFVTACTASNETPVCGDGVLDSGEQCDDGNNASNDGCSATCVIEASGGVCGDDHVDTGEDCDDGNTDSGDGCSANCLAEHVTTAQWNIKLADGTVRPCPTGYDTAAVYSQPLDSGGNPVGQPTIDLFNCADGMGTTAPLEAGVYRTWVAITTANNSATYAQTLAADVDLTTMDMTFSGDIVTDGGYFAWAWALQGETSQNPLTCADVAGIEGVEIHSTISGTMTAFTDQYNCEDGFGYTAALPADTYTIAIDAFSNAGALNDTLTLDDKVIGIKNAVTDLGTVTIPITGL
jgi:cysteine-rich repeat protein